MDRRRRFAVVLRRRLVAAALTLAACGEADVAGPEAVAFVPAEAPQIAREISWLADGADLRGHFLREPAECAVLPESPDARDAYEIGRAAFRSPLLLGGQAARLGVSCNSCHRGGRANPDFQFPGASGAPGTADVTDAFFSEVRGDGEFNPVAIPDLADSASAKVDRDAPGELEAFIRGLVVEEFAGDEPPPKVLDGLAAYVRAQRREACPETATVALDAGRHVDDLERAFAAADRLFERRDPDTLLAVLLYARSLMAPFAERFPGDVNAGFRARIVAQSRGVEAARAALRDGDLADAEDRFDDALSEGPSTADASEATSLFDEAVFVATFGAVKGE